MKLEEENHELLVTAEKRRCDLNATDASRQFAFSTHLRLSITQY